ncbi:MAG: 16S rRNA (cytosine(1402)-N(4))-methyltransferase RsmH [Flavobacteriales bacterium]|nr:16S rRNA (cytosine(1402)-N(4))-methyltransferase RsmH [Flavobacteriales bacterium]
MSSYHIPVMAIKCIDALNLKENGIYVDATYGGGGHARLILKNKKVKTLIGIDQDEDAIKNKIKDKRLIMVHHNYCYMKHFLRFHNAIPVDGVLADLGISSYQINEGSKGFSYRFDEKLDMRMDRSSETSAIDLLNEYETDALNLVFKKFGELKNSYQLAKAIVLYRSHKKIETVSQLLESIKHLSPKTGEYAFYSRVFQAIRMEVNHELDNLEKFLKQCNEVIKPGGRLVVMSYHSLEDRYVKNFINTGNIEGRQIKDSFGNLLREFNPINHKVITADEKELENNPRSRSAKLRIAEKI